MIRYVPASEAELFANMPPILYKYRSWRDPYHKKVLTESELFFAEPKMFNDPFDCGLPFRQDPADSDPVNIRRKLEELAPKQFPHLVGRPAELQREIEKQLSHILEDPEAYFQNNWGFKREDLNAIMGVLSMTSLPKNFLMWSHYADCHKGFVAGFDTIGLVTQNFGTFSRVKYSDEIPIVSALKMNTEFLHSFTFTKASFWDYEDECRFTTLIGRNKKVDFNPDFLKAVYLGCEMPHRNKLEILEIVKKKYKKAEIFEMTLSKEKFELLPARIY